MAGDQDHWQLGVMGEDVGEKLQTVHARHLDIADDGRITNLADMQPLDEQSHCSSEPVRFVLEMNQGWFRSKGIQAGQRLHGPMFRP